MSTPQNRVCAVIGVGPGIGRAFVKRFVEEDYTVAMLARREEYLREVEKEIPASRAFPCDATQEKAIRETFQRIESDLGSIQTLIYNAGFATFKSAENCSLEEFEQNWQINTLGLFLSVRAALPQLRKHDQANIIITGASAALRGRAQTAPFASSKAAQRSLAQSLARQLGPENIHVTYLIIDGVIDLPRTRQALPDKADDFFVGAEAVAETAWHLCQQDRSAWTFELDLRPFAEKW